jgi:mono/diheme cytochrome c family protein
MRNVFHLFPIFAIICLSSGVIAAEAQTLALPSFTAAQASRGEKAYMDNCASCHGDRLDNGEGDGAAALIGPAFVQGWGGKSLDDLFVYTSTNMPASAPASLSPATYADLIAFLLSKNGMAPGVAELPSDKAKLKTMAVPK